MSKSKNVLTQRVNTKMNIKFKIKGGKSKSRRKRVVLKIKKKGNISKKRKRGGRKRRSKNTLKIRKLLLTKIRSRSRKI